MNNERSSIRVLIVEDSERFRRHLTALVSGAPGFVCTSAHATATTALRLVRRDQPHVILLDLGLPDMPGLDAIEPLKTALPAAEILVLTIHNEPQTLFQALEAGASGYLHKPPTSSAHILEAIRELTEGGAPMSPAIARLVLTAFRRNVREVRALEELSAREHEVLGHLTQGLTNKEIAAALKISPRTVGSHLRNVYDKLHVRTRAAAAAKFLGHPTSRR